MSKEGVVIGKPGKHFQSASLARITCRIFLLGTDSVSNSWSSMYTSSLLTSFFFKASLAAAFVADLKSSAACLSFCC